MEENYISYDRYFEICRENAVIDPTAQDVLRELIHDLGLALDFKRLRRYDKQVLNPKWITNGVYRIINSPQVGEEGQGVLRFGALDSILHDWVRYDAEDDQNYRYPEKTHPYITGIMQEFELCYELGKDEYIVPDLLPVQEPASLDYAAYPLHFVMPLYGQIMRKKKSTSGRKTKMRGGYYLSSEVRSKRFRRVLKS